MSAFIVLLLAAASRILQLSFYSIGGINLTAWNAGLIYFGARRSRWQIVFAVLVMIATDYYLVTVSYRATTHGVFHPQSYLLTWAWNIAVCLIGYQLLHKSTTVLRVGAAVVSSATGFFLLSNFSVWAGSQMYPHSAAGLAACYAAGLPFYGNDLLSTGALCGVLFGVPALFARKSQTTEVAAQQTVA